MIEVIEPSGPSRILGLDDLVAKLNLGRGAVAPSFAAERIELVANVSAHILKLGLGRSSPTVTHFAYWTRRQALNALADSAAARRPSQCIARPRGLVFHLPPQNVETVFLYSWVISYLLGNANLTRLPTELGPDMSGLLGLFQGALSDRGDEGQFFVRYPVSEDVSRVLSAVSDARVVWGGDAKIATFSTLPLRNGGKAIWFGDRQSVAVVDGANLSALDVEDGRTLAARLHNDVFVFDQMACSSPIRLFVVGDEASHGQGVGSLLEDLSTLALTRGSAPATGHVIHKMVASMALAASGAAQRVTRHSNALTTFLSDHAGDYHSVGGGFLEVAYVPTLEAIHRSLRENIQTVVHFGFDADELHRFAKDLPAHCVTRIVPMGQALDFDIIWDGYDLGAELTRLTRIR